MKKTLITILIILILAGVGYFVGKKSFDNNALKNDTVSDSYTETNIENKNPPIQNNNNENDAKKIETKKVEEQDTSVLDIKTPNTKTTTSYMCDDRVKVVTMQDAPSLPPRTSYIRVKDNVRIASYGDWGAYIVPEYFSIDRKQIEQGYTFNETNFCKYLKN